MEQYRKLNTFYGLLSVIIWASTICLSRSLMEKVGMFTAAGTIYLLSGIISLLYYWIVRRCSSNTLAIKFSPLYLVVCGTPFILYILCLLFAIGMAKNSRQVIEVGLLNYLWPMFTLILSVPLQKKRATWWIIPGTIVALSGVMLANIIINNLQINFLDFWVNFKGSMLPYLLGFSAAILWGLYSNLACRLSTTSNVYNIPLFLLSTGILLLIIRCFLTEQSTWNGVALVELITIVIFPTIAAYVMWDSAMRRGNMILIVSLAYFSPLISTVLTGLYLGVDLTIGLWIACSLVIIGAWISKNSIKPTG